MVGRAVGAEDELFEKEKEGEERGGRVEREGDIVVGDEFEGGRGLDGPGDNIVEQREDG